MPDIINLLPDSVANQIAAGEVIQRPASAVKELLENAVDAGATEIQLIIKDSGKSLIQIIDNGCGMSETDARMSFERHATSKIKSADDLFSIRTMGFRGEALPSVAAIAQVEMKSRLHDQDTGTSLVIEGAEVKSQTAIQCSPGTSISVKNLFFNVPARRNFLKSNPVEARHIIDEFQRVALAHPQIAMSLHQNGLEVFHLSSATLRQRIVGVFGNNFNERLVPVEEQTSLLNITGFVGKPEFARKTRGEQFFFVNNRYIRDPYLHHAVQNAFEELLPRDSFATYFLYMEIDPAKIDINIHPTKTEIKFEDERSVYSILRAVVKRALGQYSISPGLDFEREPTFDIPQAMQKQLPKMPSVSINPDFNPFHSQKKIIHAGWEKVYAGLDTAKQEIAEALTEKEMQPQIDPSWDEQLKSETDHFIFQLHRCYIVTQVKSGIMLVDQQAAHERILYEKYLSQLNTQQGATQQDLFPQTIEFSSGDFNLVKEIEEEIRSLGFDIREFGKNSFVIHGTPADIEAGHEKQMLEKLVEHYKNNSTSLKLDKRENLARSMSKNISIKAGKTLSQKEMKNLIDELFACEKPHQSIEGKATVMMMTMEEVAGKFGK